MKPSTHEYGLSIGQDRKIGYGCDKCGGNPLNGGCGGLQERWFCKECYEDICFECVPKSEIVNGKSYA